MATFRLTDNGYLSQLLIAISFSALTLLVWLSGL